MSEDKQFTVDSAREAADRDELDRWVAEFLASEGSDNPVLAEALTDRPRWWIGPVQVPLKRLYRLAGPPGEPVLFPIDEDDWRDDVDDLEERVRDGLVPPPLVASYRDGQLVVEDGNHRIEALRRAGGDEAWTVIGFDDERDREHFKL
jgi:hypothetical protein